MRLVLTLPTDVAIALRRFANEMDCDVESSAMAALAEWLIAHGYLEVRRDGRGHADRGERVSL
jgi:hypothetical protein